MPNVILPSIFIGAVGALLSLSASAAIPVEEANAASGITRPSPSSYQSPRPAAENYLASQQNQSQNQNLNQSQTQAELFYQLQLLQEEIQTLRGIVESQAHAIKKLKQERLEGYLNLDRRLSELSSAVSNLSSPTNTLANRRLTAPTPAASPEKGLTSAGPSHSEPVSKYDPELEKRRYKEARNLLKSKDYQGAIKAFSHLTRAFPEGNFASNSYYWLGEIYLVLRDSSQAREAFVTLLDRYPTGRKVPDALYKLGVLHAGNPGEGQLSKQYFDRLLRDHGSTSAARLAQEFMKRQQ